MANFSLKQLRHFLAVAHTESFAQASRAIHLSTPALFESIRQLEADLGVALFIRERHKVRLSPKGQQFIAHAQSVISAASAAENSLFARDDATTGDVVIGATASVTGYFLPQILAHYRRLYPQVSVHIIEDKRMYLEQLLLNGELDIALWFGSAIEFAQSFAHYTMLHCSWQVWLPMHHPLTELRSINLAQLAEEPWILLQSEDIDSRLRALTAQMLHQQPEQRNNWHSHAIRTASVEAVRSLVAAGQGISVLPNYLFRQWSLDGARIEARDLVVDDGQEVFDPVGLYWRLGASPSPFVEQLLRLNH